MQQTLGSTFFYLLAVPTIFLFAWTVWQQITISQLKKRQKMIFQGKGKIDLEKIILECNEKSQKTDEEIEKIYKLCHQINTLSSKSLHKFSLVRFNPFRDIGGDQSFSLALLDSKNNGITLSSLYSRDGVRVYAKSIQNGVCEKHQLTEEEKHAISLAISKK